ncbi:MAG: alpha-L-glutamate ligase [Deltaproteobacteria bacterium RIFOXYB12_FULL_58_9]|nr:MAG: alpha-L-glutamate ligase [Deltaproteobacteria bacterium RIFOXYB12_FULL_58_9]
MKIAILSRGPKLYSTRRLKEAALARGHKAKVLTPLKFSIVVEQGHPRLLFSNNKLSRYDAIIPRIGASITFFGTAIVRQFEQMGVFSLSASQAISVSRDKLRTIQILSRHKIGIPMTAFVCTKHGVDAAVDEVGGAPVIIKVLEGTQGVGVLLADTKKTAHAVVETLQMARQNVLIQRFVKESKGQDIRAFVVGNKVVAAMRRIATDDEFRSNIHQGGRTEKIELDAEYERTAIHAAQIIGLRVAGVDMLESKDGPAIMEINSSPGLEGIERATGVDVADAIIEHLEDQVLFPDIDLRQRLTLNAGYGVAEFPITDRSTLVNKRLGASGLSQRDVQVLSILRGSVTIANPHGSEQLLAGDSLVCFGKLLTLKTLLPAPERRKNARHELQDAT